MHEIFQLEFSVRANQHPKSLDSRLLFRNFRAAAGCSQCFASSATLIMTAMSSTSAVLNNKSNQNQDSFIKTLAFYLFFYLSIPDMTWCRLDYTRGETKKDKLHQKSGIVKMRQRPLYPSSSLPSSFSSFSIII